jgi:hypothetical protein
MSHEEEQVRKFYEAIWNKHDKKAVLEVLHDSFRFKGSLGNEKQGEEGKIVSLWVLGDLESLRSQLQ